MAITYTLIASNTLGSSAASVTFSSIPNTYTDLVLRVSARTDEATVTNSGLWIDFNGLNTNIYSSTNLQGNGSAATSYADPATNRFYSGLATGAGATSNTFSSTEVYISNYLVSASKPNSMFTVNETNAAAINMRAVANLWGNTAAITSIRFTPGGTNFVSGSSFFLYGIKKN